MISRAAVLVALLTFAGSGAVRAQRAAPEPESAGAGVEGSFRLTGLRGTTARMVGAAALLSVGHRFAFGAGGWLMRSDLTVVRPGSTLDLAFAYGGAVGEFRLVDIGPTSWSARVLVGAGNAKLSLPAVGTEIAADNFGVVEPEISASLHLGGPVHLSVAGGYRTAFGVQDLPGVQVGDLRGWTTRLSLSLRNF